MQVISQVSVLFLLMALGYIAAKTRILDRGAFDGLNKLVLFFTLPCLTFAKLQRNALPGQMGELAETFVIAMVSMFICGAVAMLYTKKEPAARRAVFTHMAMFSNCGYMGYPLIVAALGEEKMIYAVMYTAAFNLLTWTVGVYLYAGKSGLSLKKALLNPTLIAVLLGIICFALSIRLPKVPLDAMNMLGDTTTPLAMVVIGARLADLQLSDLKDGMLLFSCLMRLIVFPLAFFSILILLRVPQGVREAVFVCSAMPGSTATAMQAEYYKGDGRLGSRSVAVSTALSVLTIPLILLLL
jgi:malate permease and related proteins